VAVVSRDPGPLLRPFVKTLWASDEGPVAALAPQREAMLPTGTAHIVFRLTAPVHIYRHGADTIGQGFHGGLVGGPRSAPYLRGLSREPSSGVGALLHPGAAVLLVGAPGLALAEQHVSLEDLWGRSAREAWQQLGEACSLSARIDLLERTLIARLPALRGVHPAVAHGLSRLAQGATIARTVAESGFSHRRFIAVVREAAGFSPKLFARLSRFQHTLRRVHAAPELSLTEVAFASGYADQAHMTREFSAFAGMSPGAYRALAPRDAHHVPMLEPSQGE
jgi:AraC-like DNA-binding protein